jgi:hypothetical protein
MRKPIKSDQSPLPLKPVLHSDGTVSYWSLLENRLIERTKTVSETELALLPFLPRMDLMDHLGLDGCSFMTINIRIERQSYSWPAPEGYKSTPRGTDVLSAFLPSFNSGDRKDFVAIVYHDGRIETGKAFEVRCDPKQQRAIQFRAWNSAEWVVV